jgi:hypothetical protein
MEKRIIKYFTTLTLAAACLTLSHALRAGEEFQAKLLIQGVANTERVLMVRISFDNNTTPEEVYDFIRAYNQGGYDAFLDAFRQAKKGLFRIFGSLGLNVSIHAVQSISTDKGRKILLFTERQSWDTQVLQSSKAQFLFMVIELNLDNKGKGDGKLYESAQVQFTDKGAIEMVSYFSAPKELFGLRSVK